MNKEKWWIILTNSFRDYIEKLFDSSYDAKYDVTKGTRLKILTPKQMLRRLPIALAQVKAGNNSESLLNEIRQIVYSLHQSEWITKKVYNNIIKSIKLWNGYYIYELRKQKNFRAACFSIKTY